MKPPKWFKSTATYNYWFAGLYAMSLIFGLAFMSGWEWLTSYLIGVFSITFGVGYGLHRLVIHKASSPPWLVRTAAIVVSVLTNTASPVLWAGSHYVHHRRSDEGDKDPHSPYHGYKILFGYYHMPALDAESKTVRTALRHVIADPVCKFVHQWYFGILALYYLYCLLFGGFHGLLVYGLVPSAIGFYGLMMLNYFGHGKVLGSYRSHDAGDTSNNVWWLWPLMFGENWHNNHHMSPGAKTTKEKWWEFDPIYLFIWLFDDDKWVHRRFLFRKFLAKFKKGRTDDYIY